MARAGSVFDLVDLSEHLTCTWGGYRPYQTWNGPPGGVQVFNKVPFNLESVVQLKTSNTRSTGEFHPTTAEGIRIGRRFANLHLLHCSEMVAGHAEPVAKLVLNYVDGQQHAFVLRYGTHFQDWNHPAPMGGTSPAGDVNTSYAWMAEPKGQPASRWVSALWHTILPNPRPDVQVVSFDLISMFSNARYNLMAATTEAGVAPLSTSGMRDPRPLPPVVEPVAQKIRFLNSATDTSATNVVAQISLIEGGNLLRWGTHRANAKGEATLYFPRRITPPPLHIRVVGPDHIVENFSVTADYSKAIALKLRRGERIGGVVLDQEERPVAAVEVTISAPEKNALGNYTLGQWPSTRTDEQGRWTLNCAGSNVLGLSLTLQHEDYIGTSYEVDDGTNSGAGTVSSAALRSATARFLINPGLTLTGQVLADGKPVNGACVTVFVTDNPRRFYRTVETDPEGRFAFQGLENVTVRLVAKAPGRAPELREVTDLHKLVTFHLQSGREIIVEVRDTYNQPIPHARFDLDSWNGTGWLHFSGQADGSGLFVWDAAPRGSLRFDIRQIGYVSLADVELEPRETPYVLKMQSRRLPSVINQRVIR